MHIHTHMSVLIFVCKNMCMFMCDLDKLQRMISQYKMLSIHLDKQIIDKV